MWIRRQHYPGKRGLVVKKAKGRRDRPGPMLDALDLPSNASPSIRSLKLRSCVGHAAGCSPHRDRAGCDPLG